MSAGFEMNDRLKERRDADNAIFTEAMDELYSQVLRNKKGQKKAALMSRRLPSGKLRVRDLLKFTAKSLSAKDVVYVLLICAVVALLGMLAPMLNKQIFDSIIPSGEVGNLVPIAFVLAAAGIGGIMFEVSKNLMLMRVKDKMYVDLQAAIVDRTFNLPASFFRKHSAGEVSSRVLAVSNISALLGNSVVSGILTMVFSLVYFYQIFKYANSLLGICVLIILANIVLSTLGYFSTKRFQGKIQPANADLNGFMLSMMNGMQKIKTGGAEQRAFAKWAKLFWKASPDQADAPLFLSLMPALSVLLSVGGTMLIYSKAFSAGLSLSDYIAFTVAFGMVTGAMASFNSILPSMAFLNSQFDLLRPIMETEPESEDDSVTVTHLTGSIEVNNLKFRYSEDSPYLYDGLNLRIRPGEYVALVGTSGCGKTTLMRLLLGLEKPESGTIFYDHYNIANVNRQSLRRHIGTCLQDKTLFGGSILQNICITAPNSTIADAWEAAELAGIADDIREMPMQMHTIIHENGSGLSGGQRQRILIARALINKPSILFLDEATSALDNVCQEKVSQNLAKTRCTRVCIAHRLSTVMACDRILVLDHGKIVEEGNYTELMARKGIFYDLSRRQL